MPGEDERVCTAAGRLLKKPVAGVEFIGAGRNSQVYRVLGSGGQILCAAKLYFRPAHGGPDRLQKEFQALAFLWRHGVRCVPEPLAAEPTLDCALYEHIVGTPVDSRQVAETDVDEIVDFLGVLKGLAGSEDSEALPAAAEACFSFAAIEDNLRLRLSRLLNAGGEDRSHQDMRRFLTDDLVPALTQALERCRQHPELGSDYDRELTPSLRTLSPSDVGFHNTLRRPEGRLVFLDFEYFGWDDPAKTICDFVLHPALSVPVRLNARFVRGALGCLASRTSLRSRVQLQYPLWTLKWCLILLNEFLSEHWQRRRFAARATANHTEILQEQLKKAQRLLQRMIADGGELPFQY